MSLVGHWQLELMTPFGIQRLRVEVRDDAGALVGTITSVLGAAPLARVRLSGESLQLTAEVKLPFGEHKLEFLGVLRNDKMWGKCRSTFGRNDFMGERQPP